MAVSAAELERFVVDRIRDVGRDPAVLQETLAATDATPVVVINSFVSP